MDMIIYQINNSINPINNKCMKKFLTFVCALCISGATFAQFSGSGSGTASDPYLIFNPIQLDQVRNFLGQSGVCFKLMADIDLTEFIADNYPSDGWLPIGNLQRNSKALLMVIGKTITGLTINRVPLTMSASLVTLAKQPLGFDCSCYIPIKSKQDVRGHRQGTQYL